MACVEKAHAVDNYTLTIYSQIIGYTDNLKTLRALLNYPLIGWVSQYFSRTRSAEAKLGFAELCREIITYHRQEISDEEYERYDRVLLGYELSAYDRLNRWRDYIALYEQAVSAGRLRAYSWDRYPISCRKQARAEAGKSVEHLKRHQQSRLSEKELLERHDEMDRLFEFIKHRHSK